MGKGGLSTPFSQFTYTSGHRVVVVLLPNVIDFIGILGVDVAVSQHHTLSLIEMLACEVIRHIEAEDEGTIGNHLIDETLDNGLLGFDSNKHFIYLFS